MDEVSLSREQFVEKAIYWLGTNATHSILLGWALDTSNKAAYPDFAEFLADCTFGILECEVALEEEKIVS